MLRIEHFVKCGLPIGTTMCARSGRPRSFLYFTFFSIPVKNFNVNTFAILSRYFLFDDNKLKRSQGQHI